MVGSGTVKELEHESSSEDDSSGSSSSSEVSRYVHVRMGHNIMYMYIVHVY